MQDGLNATQKAGITETLFALTGLLGSKGKLSFAIPFVDDEGVDVLVYKRKSGGKVLYIQVKSRFTLTSNGHFRSQVRKKSFTPRKDLYLVFVYYDNNKQGLGDTLWLIPTLDFMDLIKGQKSNRKFYIFHTKFTAQNDMWVKYRLSLKDLSQKLLVLIENNR